MAAAKGKTWRKPRRPAPASPQIAAWVRRTIARMTLDEKLGQLLMLTVHDEFGRGEDEGARRLARRVAEGKAGGLMLEVRRTAAGLELNRVYATAARLNELQRGAKIPLFVAADFETGTAMRLSEGTSLPHPMAVAATGVPRDALACGRITALEARAAGVNWIFAPVADLSNNPANPIINIRSFGEEPRQAGEFVAEFVRGAQSAGVLATAKHFPGHGDTEVDSHMGLPVIRAARERLNRLELEPFRAAVAAGASSIMTAHLLAPALEPDPTLPATLSPNILRGLLRGEMGFNGLIITDSLDMSGVTLLHPPSRAAVLAVVAGADVLLAPPSPEAALEALREAVRAGVLTEERINESVERILLAKARLGLREGAMADLGRLRESFAAPAFARQALEIAARGVALLRDPDRLLPLDAAKPARVLLVAVSADAEPLPGRPLEEEIRRRTDSLEVRRADSEFARPAGVELPPSASYDVAIVAIYVRVADRKGSLRLPAEQAALVERVLAAGKPAVVACFGSPYLIAQFPGARAWIAGFSTQPVVESAVGRAIFGETAVQGRLPVRVPGALPLGAGTSLEARPMTLGTAPARMRAALEPAFALLDRAVRERAFPGGVAAIGHRNRVVVRPVGRLDYRAKSPQATAETVYDAASLTKPVVTATLAMTLVEAGDLRLDAPAGFYLPSWNEGPQREWRAKATVADLLRHSAGLPAHREFYRATTGYGAIVARALSEPLAYEPGTKIVYSDLDFMLLGEIVRQATGEPLDELARRRIFEPLGMASSGFRPSRRLRPRIAPTENDEDWRKRPVRGDVHDQNASAMGGVAGHAGLFTTAGDLAVFCQMLLNGGIYAHRRLLARKTIAEFTRRYEIDGNAFALGWDVPADPSSSGRYFSPASFGHTGFTGTSVWIDPKKELFAVLLTNRVHPSVGNNRIRQVRPAFHDAVVRGLGLAPGR